MRDRRAGIPAPVFRAGVKGCRMTPLPHLSDCTARSEDGRGDRLRPIGREVRMALVDRTSISRYGIAAIAAGVLVALAVANSGPAWGQDTGDPAEAPAALEAEATAPAGMRMMMGGAGDDSDAAPLPPADTSGAFVYRDGTFTPLDKIPGAALSTHFANNNRGQIAGFYLDALPGPDGTASPGTTHGFVRDRRGVTKFDVPDASFILVKGINNRGEVVGEYGGPDAIPGPDGTVPPGTIHGFVRDPRGVITTFDVPFFLLHDVADINDRGVIVGYYDKLDGTSGGYLRNKGGQFIRIDFPGASYTTIHGLNNRNQIVGGYLEGGAMPNPDGTVPPGVVHGFLWERGRFTTLDVPGSIWTQPFGINDRGEIWAGTTTPRGNSTGSCCRRGSTRRSMLHARSTTSRTAISRGASTIAARSSSPTPP